ncbi:MAG: SpoIID/LytB domain-containing protein [Lachnospiraceae bacterium]|nr:SpoIID/LytB domain-containing protein [Lachnospiraceae bacterium]
MKFDVTRFVKLALIFFGLLFLVCLWFGRRQPKPVSSPEGEKITVEDVEILLDALGVSISLSETNGTDQSQGDQETGDREDYLTYGQYEEICRQIGEEEWQLPHYEEKYEAEHGVLKQDWYEAFRILLAHLDTESSIWETTVFLLKVDREAGEAYTENGAMQGANPYRSTAFAENVFQEMKVYVQGNTLLTIVEVLPEEHELGSVWVMESTDGVLDCFYHQTVFQASISEKDGVSIPEREQIADLTFRDGRIIEAKERNEKIHGKLLRVSGEELEIEDYGVYRIAEEAEVYKLYGNLKTLQLADLRVGCADTDFVIHKDKIYACLVSEAQKADQIRVLLKNTAAGSDFHEAVKITVDGEQTKLRMEQMTIGERRTYRSENLTDKVLVEMEGSTRSDHAYRGAIECLRMEQGIVVVNELPLEEYLYAVVPSEMPASYPQEALKAQAVCARTYAYLYILRAGLPALGAHVDDTTAYQVYHNIGENVAATMAVKETDGMLLTYQGEAAGNYYYSTSCGAGTDVVSWQGGNGEVVPYLRGVRVSEADGTVGTGFDVESLRDEEAFRKFITTVHEEDLEKDEPWYRWIYRVEELDEKAFLARLKARYEAAPASILTKAEGEYYVSEPSGKPGKIKRIEVEKRGEGGIAQELTIEAEKATYKVLSEYNIRYVLCDRESAVRKQDGSETVPGMLLPSGFFVLDTVVEAGKDGESVVGYTLTGGGFGHGVGMSQNGAKALGEQGADYGQILSKFYPGCDVKDAEELRE